MAMHINSKIIPLYLEGHKVEGISQLLKISEEDVKNQLVVYRLERISNFFKDVKDVQELDFLSEYIINSVYSIEKNDSIDRRRQLNNIIKLAEDGLLYSDIGEIMNLSRERIRQLIIEYAPEIVYSKEINKYTLCEQCNIEKKRVYKRAAGKFFCNSCNNKNIKKNKKKWSRDYDKCIDCDTTSKPHHSYGRCVLCYSKFNYHFDLKRRKVMKTAGERWRKKNKGRLKKKNSAYAKEYNKRPEVIKKRKLEFDEKYYGGNREKAIIRDECECQICGISRDESFKELGRDLYVDHIDDKDNSELSNLLTVCQKCHNERVMKKMRIELAKSVKKNFNNN